MEKALSGWWSYVPCLGAWIMSVLGRVEQVEFWKNPPQPSSPAAPKAGGGLRTNGLMLSSMAIPPMSNAAVQAMLPGGLELGPQTLAPAGQHPICFMFCLQKDVRPPLLGLGLKYLELILAVPFVQWTHPTNSYRGPFIFMPRLYLDRWLPVILGWFYGFAKVRARMSTAENYYRVRSLLRDRPIISGDFAPHGPIGPPSSFPHFEPVRDLFRQPFVAKSIVGPFICSRFDFHLDDAHMQSIDATVHLTEAFVPGLAVGDFHVPGIDMTPVGAFYIQIPWTLSPPFRCGCLKTGQLMIKEAPVCRSR